MSVEVLATLAGSRGVATVALAGDGGLASAAAVHGKPRLYRIEGGARPAATYLATMPEPQQDVRFTPDGRLLVGALDGEVMTWRLDLEARPAVALVRRERPHGALDACVSMSPDGGWVATSATDRTLFWRLDDERLQAAGERAGSAYGVAFSADSRWAYVMNAGGEQGEVWRLDAEAGRAAPALALPGTRGLGAFVGGSLDLLTAPGRGVIWWSLDPAQGRVERHGNLRAFVPGQASCLRTSPSGLALVVGSAEGLWAWALEPAARTAAPLGPLPGAWDAACAPDGTWLVGSERGQPARLLRLRPPGG